MKANVRFISGSPTGRHVSTYMGETFMERLEITAPERVNVALISPMMVPWNDCDPGKETRREFGDRLRRAASEAARFYEKAILDALREQGHLV